VTYKEYFNQQWPNEGVGYIKDGVFYPLENTAEDKRWSFEVDPAFLLEEPDCLLHSHCVGNETIEVDPHSPSFEDMESQIATAIEWGICVCDGETCEDPVYWGNPKNRPELIGRDFIFNVQDCLSLCQDWFYSEKGIELPNQPRNAFWNEEGQNYMEELYETWGFDKVELTELQAGDVLFYKVRSKVVNHLGIYLGNNEVISHWYGRVSCIESFGKWAGYIEFAARLRQ
jgi:hypothetical protein